MTSITVVREDGRTLVLPPPPPASTPSVGIRPNVLLIEDDPDVGRILEVVLQASGYAVTLCRSLSTARDWMRDGSYSLYLVDLLLPDGTGYELIDEIKQANPAGHVVVISGLKQQQSFDRCMALGAADYITKPFSPSELVQRVGTWIKS